MFSKRIFCNSAEWPNKTGISVVNDPGKVIVYTESIFYYYIVIIVIYLSYVIMV